jgi:hypothetical protein
MVTGMAKMQKTFQVRRIMLPALIRTGISMWYKLWGYSKIKGFSQQATFKSAIIKVMRGFMILPNLFTMIL